MKSENECILLTMAEHQLLGFFHAQDGFSLVDLVRGMGLTKEEFDMLCKSGAIQEERQEEVKLALKEIK